MKMRDGYIEAVLNKYPSLVFQLNFILTENINGNVLPEIKMIIPKNSHLNRELSAAGFDVTDFLTIRIREELENLIGELIDAINEAES